MGVTFWLSLIGLGLIGWFNEFMIVGRINQLEPPAIILLTILVIPIYAVIAIAPTYYLQHKIKR